MRENFMIALFLIPIYIVFSIFICRWLFYWMSACHRLFRKKWMKIAVIAVYSFFSASILISFLLPVSAVQRLLKRIGNYWLGVLLYIVLTVLIVELLRFLIKRSRRISTDMLRSRKFVVVSGTLCIGIIAAFSLYGIFNARYVRTTSYQVKIEKDGGKKEHLKIALAADLHLGYSVGVYHVREMVDKINAMNADLVLIAGDIFDNEYEAIEEPDEICSILKEIKSRYGVYACYGNHDIEEKILVGFTFPNDKKKESDPRMDRFLEDAKITLLRDESVLIDDSFYLVGRPDYERPGRGIEQRKSPEEIMAELDESKPVFILEHEPREIEELSEAGADMQLCGHTHDGQVWPGTWTIHLFWENPYGYLKKGELHSIVTSGIGVYGPAMRVDSKSEVCEIDLEFQ